MKRKIIALCLIVAMLGVAVISGTMAYFTDTEAAVNVMTIGSVKIEQIEQERNAAGDLVPFTQAKPAIPAVYADGSIPYAAADKWVVANDEAWKVVEENENVIDKFITVKNTGKSSAYVRTIIAFEVGKDAVNDAYMHLVCNGNNSTTPWTYEWVEENGEEVVVEIKGGYYKICVFTHSTPLAAGETTDPSVKQVYLDKKATNEVCEAYGETFEILAISQAIQSSGFNDAKTALNAGFEEVTAANAKAWFGELNIPVVVSDADALVEALENGEDVVLEDDVKIDPAGMSNAYGTTGINVKNGQTIDGNGNTLDIKGAGGTWDSGINTTGGLIKNITVTGSFRGIFINHNSTHSEPVVLENVTIEGTTYTISCDQGMNQTLTATNSTFNGWTSFAATLGDAKFIDCDFGEGNGYAYCRPYAPTEFVGCDFEAGYTIDPCAAVTFENCTIGGQPLTAANLGTLIDAYYGDAANATVIG